MHDIRPSKQPGGLDLRTIILHMIKPQMENKGIRFAFTSKPWLYAAPGGWYFVSLPTKLSTEIRGAFKSEEAGWGRLKATARIGKTEWKTAIWFDTKKKTYVLPLKAEIRKIVKVEVEKDVKVILWI
jgi:Domain of unknown function (DUF1905)